MNWRKSDNVAAFVGLVAAVLVLWGLSKTCGPMDKAPEGRCPECDRAYDEQSEAKVIDKPEQSEGDFDCYEKAGPTVPINPGS